MIIRNFEDKRQIKCTWSIHRTYSTVLCNTDTKHFEISLG